MLVAIATHTFARLVFAATVMEFSVGNTVAFQYYLHEVLRIQTGLEPAGTPMPTLPGFWDEFWAYTIDPAMLVATTGIGIVLVIVSGFLISAAAVLVGNPFRKARHVAKK